MARRQASTVKRIGQPVKREVGGISTGGVGREGQPHPFYYTKQEAADMLRIHRSTLYRMMNPKYKNKYRPELVVTVVAGKELISHMALAAYARNIEREQGHEEYAEAV